MVSNAMQIYKGDDGTWKITVKDASGDPVDITGAAIIFTAKTSEAEAPSIQRRSPLAGGDVTQIEITDATKGEFKVHLVPSDTENLEAGNYVYDIQMTLNSKVRTIIKSKLTLLEDVTK